MDSVNLFILCEGYLKQLIFLKIRLDKEGRDKSNLKNYHLKIDSWFSRTGNLTIDMKAGKFFWADDCLNDK